MIEVNGNYLSQYNNSHTQVRENLINEDLMQSQQIPIQQIMPCPVVNPPVQYNIMLDIHIQQNIIPSVPITRYKWPLEMWLLLGCVIQILWFQHNIVHFLWAIWYLIIGFWRHRTLMRKIRFWGQLINMLIWIIVNCYVFSDHSRAMFPFAVIMANLDYYFIGGQLASIYLFYFSYILGQWCSDLKLYIIFKMLRERKDQMIQKSMERFLQNEKNYQKQMKVIQLNSNECLEQNMIREQISTNQRPMMNENSCIICSNRLETRQSSLLRRAVRLDCNHRFHFRCLNKIIQSQHFKCPICKRAFMQ